MLPSLSEVKEAVKKSSSSATGFENLWKKLFDSTSVGSQEAYNRLQTATRLQGLQEHFRHKKYWSYFLMGVMFVMIFFQSVLLGLVGAGIWSFKDYDWLLPALLAQNLAQIVGLAVFVVRSLFSDPK